MTAPPYDTSLEALSALLPTLRSPDARLELAHSGILPRVFQLACGVAQPNDYAEQDESQHRLALVAARVCRSACVLCEEAQEQIAPLVPSLLLPALLRLTSYSVESSAEAILQARTLTQVFANAVTGNEQMQEALLPELGLAASDASAQAGRHPGVRVLLRILTSADGQTRIATSVLLLNIFKGQSRRQTAFLQLEEAKDLLDALLENAKEAVREMEAAEDAAAQTNGAASNSASARTDPEHFGISYEFFADFFANGLFSQIFRRLAPAASVQQESGEALALENSVSQHQLTLLKLLDAFLHSQPGRYLANAGASGSKSSAQDLLVLVSSFMQLAQAAESSMKLILSTSSAPPSAASEAQAERLILHEQTLVALHEALLLHLQCLQYLVLLDGDRAAEVQVPAQEHASTSLVNAAQDVTATMRQREGFIERVVSLLHATALFSPPVSPFKPTEGPSSSPRNAPDGSRLTSTGVARSAPSDDAAAKRPALASLKRDLVRLLGALAYVEPERSGALRYELEGEPARPEPAGGADSTQADSAAEREHSRRKAHSKLVQDRVREAGGLWDVLNLTQLDELNPYIREHALFALRNLLVGNPASQELVAQLKPLTPEEAAASASA